MISARTSERPADGAAAAALFDELLDDAALFPPQSATLAEALRAHVEHRASAWGSLQGAFVVPARAVAAVLAAQPQSSAALRLSVVIDYADFAASVAAVCDALGTVQAPGVSIGMVEIRLSRADVPLGDLEQVCAEVRRFATASALPQVFFESARMNSVPGEAESLARASLALRVRVPGFVGTKIRSGGVTSDGFPSSETVARFIVAMRDHGVAWKATAGLHHPVRGSYGGLPMHGFLNVLVATLAAHANAASLGLLVEALDDTDATNLRLGTTTFAWRDSVFDAAAIGAARRGGLRSIGSCSFTEPVGGLRELGMLA